MTFSCSTIARLGRVRIPTKASLRISTSNAPPKHFRFTSAATTSDHPFQPTTWTRPPQRQSLSTTPPKPSLSKLIQKLRAATGAPMLECKKALVSVDNHDLDQASDWLRKHGSAKASSKVSGRDATEGLVGLAISNENAALVKISSETDFASRSEAFAKLVNQVADAVLRDEKGCTSNEEWMNVELEHEKGTIKEAFDNAILAIRENLSIDKIVAMRGGEKNNTREIVAGYVHGKSPHSNTAGSAASIIKLSVLDACPLSEEDIRDIGKKLAMHVVAAKPMYLNARDVPTEMVEKEKDIYAVQMADSGKPPNIMEKIIEGKMRKYYEEVCLVEQPHMAEEGSPKIAKFLKKQHLNLIGYELIVI